MLAQRVSLLPYHSLGKPSSSPDPVTKHTSTSLLVLVQDEYEAGRLENAIRTCLDILADEPTNVSALLLLAELALQSDQLDCAQQIAALTVDTSPECALAHLSLARIHQARCEEDSARKSYLEAIRLEPTMQIALYNLAQIHFSRQDYRGAVGYGQKVIALDSSSPDYALLLGRSFLALGDFELAHKFLSQANLLRPNDLDIINSLARAVQRLRRSEDAIHLYRLAIEINPESTSSWEGLGIAQRALGRFDDAAASFDEALQLDPGSHESHCALAFCRRAVAQQLLLEPLLTKLENASLTIENQISIRFALGKQFDDHGMYDDAFRHYVEGNLLFKAQAAEKGYVFEATDFRSHIDRIIERFGKTFFDTHKECGIDTDIPVFIVGHPRSGTSLTEQILASHPSVYGAGELQHIGDLSCRVFKHWQEHGVISQKSLRREAGLHLGHLQLLGGNAARVIDKLPDNVLLLGLIAAMYPKARVIMCHRDIRDNILSCFFQRFSEGLLFSNDLWDCAFRHIEVERLMSHWRTVLPLEILDLQYENLVEDLEGETHRLLQFLHLDWNPSCLNFYETERTVNTASVWSVRQPIYNHSIGRWRSYRRHLAELLPMLEKADPVIRETEQTP